MRRAASPSWPKAGPPPSWRARCPEKSVRHLGAVVPGKPNLIHPIVQANDTVVGITFRTSCTCRWGVGGKRSSVARSAMGSHASSRREQQSARHSSSYPQSGGPRAPDSTQHRRRPRHGGKDLFDVGRRVTDMDHLGPPSPIMKGRFSTVSWPMETIRSAPVDPLMGVVAQREGGRSRRGWTRRHRALSHLGSEKRNPHQRTKFDSASRWRRGRLAAAPSMISGRLASRII